MAIKGNFKQHQQMPIVDENIPHSQEKDQFHLLIKNAIAHLENALTKRVYISEARALVVLAQRDIFNAVLIYAKYMSDDSDEVVPVFVNCIAITSTVANSLSKTFIEHDNYKKSVTEVAAVISNSIPILDKILFN